MSRVNSDAGEVQLSFEQKQKITDEYQDVFFSVAREYVATSGAVGAIAVAEAADQLAYRLTESVETLIEFDGRSNSTKNRIINDELESRDRERKIHFHQLMLRNGEPLFNSYFDRDAITSNTEACRELNDLEADAAGWIDEVSTAFGDELDYDLDSLYDHVDMIQKMDEMLIAGEEEHKQIIIKRIGSSMLAPLKKPAVGVSIVAFGYGAAFFIAARNSNKT